jgi:hypothetical protein
MQVYVGQFRYMHEGEVEVFLATTEDKSKGTTNTTHASLYRLD